MDPTTTLVTFLLQTDPSVQSVQLIGSWDAFSTCYTMERDIPRGRGRWRGCFSFKNIVCDHQTRHGCNRNGGLKMGHTYYYYYEVDGSTETYDPTMPCTTACPYMPGQTVNTLNVPIERTLRHRRASMSSMRQEDFMTMNPGAKFSNPKPATPAHSDAGTRRTASSSILRHAVSSPSLSLAPSWKRFFCRKTHNEPQSGRLLDREDRDDIFFTSHDKIISPPTQEMNRSRASTPTEGSRTRDISPESLRRFLCEEIPATGTNSTWAGQPALTLPDDGDETDDDDNFATSAALESLPYTTGLSPPPFQRSASLESMSAPPVQPSSLTPGPAKSSSRAHKKVQDVPDASAKHTHSALPRLETKTIPRWSISVAMNAMAPPTSYSPEDEHLTFYDSNDEDDILSSNDEETLTYMPLVSTSTFQQHPFKGYRLPQQTEEGKSSSHQTMPVNGSNLLGSHVDSGLDDFFNELGWIVEVMGTTSGN